MNLECDKTNTEGVLVHPDMRTTSDTTLSSQTISEEIPQTRHMQNPRLAQQSPLSPKQTEKLALEPPKLVRNTKIKKRPKPKKRKSGYRDMMSSILAPQQTESEKKRNHLDKVFSGTGHGAFSKVDKI